MLSNQLAHTCWLLDPDIAILSRYEKLLGEMLNHLERQPRNRQRRVAWLTLCEPLLDGLGLVLLAHFRRLFPLFFKWLHADDDETVLLVRLSFNEILYGETDCYNFDAFSIKCLQVLLFDSSHLTWTVGL